MNYRLLFLDVDGTLKQEPYGVSEQNKQAILKACHAGKKVSIASGRNKDLLTPLVKELQLDQFSPSYSIALNGAHIFENQTGNTLHLVPIPMNVTLELFQLAFQHEVSCHVYTENLVYFNYYDEQFHWYEKGGCTCRIVSMERPELGIEEIPLKFFFFSKDRDKLNKIKELAHEKTKKLLNAEFSSIYSLEYTSKSASKGLGMEYICDQYQLPLSQAIAAGDGENDRSMIEMAGLGIAMKNALDTVKAVAKTITKRTCLEDGVTEIIQEHLLS